MQEVIIIMGGKLDWGQCYIYRGGSLGYIHTVHSYRAIYVHCHIANHSIIQCSPPHELQDDDTVTNLKEHQHVYGAGKIEFIGSIQNSLAS